VRRTLPSITGAHIDEWRFVSIGASIKTLFRRNGKHTLRVWQANSMLSLPIPDQVREISKFTFRHNNIN
jgi:hypothetical protein